MFPDQLQYGGFWRRFAALWIDFLCLLPLTLLYFWANERYRLFAAYYFIPGQILGIFYSVYLVRRFGGTPGKLAMGLRICCVDGSPAGYREAFLRYLPDLILSVLVSIALIYASFAISDAEYHSFGFLERTQRLTQLTPLWFHPLQIIQQVWVWGEFVVLLTNRKRRAIHDFLAGTVVILRPSASLPANKETDDRPAPIGITPPGK
jgi:uncharacterized RDD family membrane protein YckC